MRSQAESITRGSPAKPRANSQIRLDERYIPNTGSPTQMPPLKAFAGSNDARARRSSAKGKSSELAYIDTLANSKIRLNGVKRMTQIQNTS